MNSSVDNFLEKIQAISPTVKKRTFEKKRTIDRIYTGAKPNQGKYQFLPLTGVVNSFPYTVLPNTREIKMPRKNIAPDGTEQILPFWIKLLPKTAYTIKDPSTGREVSALTAADEQILDQAYTIWEELFQELDAKNNAMNPNIGGIIRRKVYTIWPAYVLNFWTSGDTRTPARSNFSALMVVTSKSFMDLVGESISDTNITSGISNPNWIEDVYNRELTNRKGFVMFSINKGDSPGFNISISHQLNSESYLQGVRIPEEDAELMQNPVEMFLGWQALKEEGVPADQRRLFNKNLILEAIEYMTDLLARARMAKQNGLSVEEAIAATNKTALAGQVPTDSRGQATNDPMLAEMAQKAASQQGFGSGYGNANTVNPGNVETIQERNVNPFTNPLAGHFDPLTGAPEATGNAEPVQAAPFSKPSFAGGGFGSGTGPF